MAIGLAQDKLVRFASREAAEAEQVTLPEGVDRWEARYSSFADCWLLAALSDRGYLMGYLLRE